MLDLVSVLIKSSIEEWRLIYFVKECRRQRFDTGASLIRRGAVPVIAIG